MGIGVGGTLPWRLPMDMRFFKQLTVSTRDPLKRNAVIMGRKTWASIPSRFRPLADRISVVLSTKDENTARAEHAVPPEVLIASSLEEAMTMLSTASYCDQVESIFVIGGAALYSAALRSSCLGRVFLTHVDLPEDESPPKFDAFLDATALAGLSRVSLSRAFHEGPIRFEFATYTRVPGLSDEGAQPPVVEHGELQYLRLVRDVMAKGALRGDRTGTGTLSLFGAQMRFNLRDSFPLLTTKSVFWRGVAEELLWFVSGSTCAHQLRDRGVHIWDGNSSRAYLDSVGLVDREEGDLGPVYGWQWRHFGAEYKDRHTDYGGQGVDQLSELIEGIRNQPNSRRHIISAWNPPDLPKMALPPCHVLMQFFVANGELSCQMYQRSADLGLGVPFNIASYALLTYLVAHVTGLRPGDFVHTIGDAHGAY